MKFVILMKDFTVTMKEALENEIFTTNLFTKMAISYRVVNDLSDDHHCSTPHQSNCIWLSGCVMELFRNRNASKAKPLISVNWWLTNWLVNRKKMKPALGLLECCVDVFAVVNTSRYLTRVPSTMKRTMPCPMHSVGYYHRWMNVSLFGNSCHFLHLRSYI